MTQTIEIDLQINDSINAPLHHLLQMIENPDVKLAELMHTDIKLIYYNMLIDELAARIDDISNWIFQGHALEYNDALFGQIRISDKSKQFLNKYLDELCEFRQMLIIQKKAHMMANLDKWPHYKIELNDDVIK